MLLTELNTHVLLHVYRYLDLIDSINLAETCTRLRDVAKLHYNRFQIFDLGHYSHYHERANRNNRIDATVVLKHIGPFIRVLNANLDANVIGPDVSTSIRKYCVDVKTLIIIEGRLEQSHNPYTAYSEWLRKLSLTKISLSNRDLLLIDLSETTTLEELDIHFCSDYAYKFTTDHGRVADIFERNCNIRSLSIPLSYGFPHHIFEKLKCLKTLRLHFGYDERGEHLEKVSANLKMMALEDVAILVYTPQPRVDSLNEFLQKLSENALHLRCLSIQNTYVEVDTNTLSILQLLNLTSLHLNVKHPHIYKEIPKIQPNLKLLKIMIYDFPIGGVHGYTTLTEPMEKIIFLIKNLNKLEILYIWFINKTDLALMLKDFLQESVLCRIFDCYSDKRLLYLTCECYHLKHHVHLVELKLQFDFGARKWTWTRSDVEQFSGTPSDVNSVKDEGIKWLDNLYT